MINNFLCSIHYNFWFKKLDTASFEAANQNSIKVPIFCVNKKDNFVVKLWVPVSFTVQCPLPPCVEEKRVGWQIMHEMTLY